MAKKKTTTISKRMKVRSEQRRKQRLIQIAIAAIVVVILVGAAWAFWDSNNAASSGVIQASLPTNISVDEAFEMYEAGDFLLDVRTPQEWDEYHIPGSTLIPLDELESRVDEIPQDQNVVVVCRSGNRSQIGRDTLRTAGFSQVTSMDGGMSAWRDSGYPIE